MGCWNAENPFYKNDLTESTGVCQSGGGPFYTVKSDNHPKIPLLGEQFLSYDLVGDHTGGDTFLEVDMLRKNFMILLVFSTLVLSTLACEFSASTASVSEAVLARDAEGTQPTTTFTTTDSFYCLVELANAPDGTTVRAVWTAVEVEGNDPNTLIDESSVESGSGDLEFNLTNSSPWPVGSYKVDLYLNDELDRTIEFNVQE